jgi:cell division protein FtsB
MKCPKCGAEPKNANYREVSTIVYDCVCGNCYSRSQILQEENSRLRQIIDEDKTDIPALYEEIDTLKAEVETLKSRHVDFHTFCQVLEKAQRDFPNGYTLVDFQAVWLSQERDTVNKLKAENDRLREGMKKLEWVGPIPWCAACYSWKTKGHKPDCWLSALLNQKE